MYMYTDAKFENREKGKERLRERRRRIDRQKGKKEIDKGKRDLEKDADRDRQKERKLRRERETCSTKVCIGDNMIMSPMISLPPIRISVFSTEQNRFCKLGQHAYECSHILNAADI